MKGLVMLRTGNGAVFDVDTPWSPLDQGNEKSEALPHAATARRDVAAGWEPSVYQPSRRSGPVAFAGSLLAVAGLLSALTWLNVTVVTKTKPDLVTINLAVSPPPPPAHPPIPHPRQTMAPPNQPQIVALPPIVPVAAPPQTVATTPTPNPLPTIIAVPAAPAVPAASAPMPAVASAADLSSTMISAKTPTYPLESRRRHEEGTVVLKLLLSTDGQVSDISVARGSGSDRLDQAALSAVRKWRWKPLLRNGEPVMVQGMVTIPFVLKR